MNKIYSWCKNQPVWQFFESEKVFWIITVIIAIIKLWLVNYLKIQTIFYEYDDLLYLRLAEQIIQGKWLGPLMDLTLMRGPFYPLFIAFNFYLGTPLLLLEQGLYILASIWFARALKPLCKNNIFLLLILAVILFNPMTYNGYNMGRVARAGIFPALVICVFAGSIGLLLNWQIKMKQLILWAIGFGCALAAYWLTRDQGFLLLPSLALLGSAAVWKTWRNRSMLDWKKRIFVFALPFVIWAFLLAMVSSINWIYYRVFCTADINLTEFNDAYGALMRVKPRQFLYKVTIDKETRMRIYAVSPAFTELKPYLEGSIGNKWADWGGRPDHEIPHIFSGFREALTAAGYYKDGKALTGYCKRLAQEVNAACDSGKLECFSRRSTLAPPWYWEYWPILKGDFVYGVTQVLGFTRLLPYNEFSFGTPWMDLEKYFSDITNNLVMPIKQWHIKGWVFNPQESVQITLLDKEGKYVREILLTLSPDLYNSFKMQGKDFSGARQAEFDCMLPSSEYKFLIKIKNRVIDTVPLDGSRNWIENPELVFQLIVAEQPGILKCQSAVAKRKMRVLEKIGKVYQRVSPGLMVLAIIIYGWISVLLVLKKYQFFILWAIQTAIGFGMTMMLVFLVYVNATTIPVLIPGYLAPMYPMVLMFIVVSWLGIINLLFSRDKSA